ncbi:MAG: hypothetical protein ACRC3Z_09680 [Phocaeicola sp.]
MKNYIPHIISVLIYSAIIFCVGRYSVEPKEVKVPVVEWSIPDTVYVPVPSPAEIIKVPVPVDVDTAAILQQFYTQNVYTRPIIDTPKLTVHLTDTVYNNVLLGSTASYRMAKPIKHDLSVGFLGSSGSFSFVGTYSYDRIGVTLGYDFLNKSPIFGTKYYLFKW